MKEKIKPVVAIVVGSSNDLNQIKGAEEILQRFEIPYQLVVCSAHRNPEGVRALAKNSKKEGIKVIIAAAGYAAHLAGVIASQTVLPVIGVPLDTSPLAGFDSLLSMTMMPSGIPVAVMTVGVAGAKNAALFAMQILALEDKNIEKKLIAYRRELSG